LLVIVLSFRVVTDGKVDGEPGKEELLIVLDDDAAVPLGCAMKPGVIPRNLCWSVLLWRCFFERNVAILSGKRQSKHSQAAESPCSSAKLIFQEH